MLDGSTILLQEDFGIQGESFTCAAFTEKDELYVGTSGNRLIRYQIEDGGLKEIKRINCMEIAQINSLNLSEEGYVLVCADNGVGYVDRSERFRKINTGQFNSSIDHMIFDYQGNLWFTSSRLGLLKLCETPFTEIYSKLGLSKKVVNAVIRWQDDFYFGTDSGLDMADGELSAKLENALTERLSGVRIRSFLADSRGSLWICTSGMGVWRVDADGSVSTYDSGRGTLGDKFRCALEMQDGTIALAGDLGLTFVRDGRIAYTIGKADGLENPKVLCLAERADGGLLAGTDGNGIAVIKDGKVEKILRKEEGLSSKVVLRMVADGEGYFIVTGSGMCYMESDGKVRALDQFPYYNNYDVTKGPGGELFVSGSAGIYVINREALLSGETPEYLLLDFSMGLRASLTANAWNYVDEKDRLYLAGDEGVTIVDMKNYNAGRRSYRMNLSSVQLDDMVCHVKLGEAVSIPRGNTRIVISPEVINYSTSNPYVSYYLEGFDTGRKVFPLSELKEVVYTNLSAGNYIFHLAVLDERGRVASENTYEIVKEADIYEERWFLFYVAIVFVLTIVYLSWMLFRTQVQKTLNIQKRELELARKQVEMGNEAIFTIAMAVDAKDANTSEHSFRVSQYSNMIAGRMGLPKETCEELRKAALLHDIGKIGIPDSVLNKPGKLNEEEYALMKSHVTKGAEILRGFTAVGHIVEGAQYHHERYDGKGYAEGLKGEEIPLYARIIGIADAFDAMTANRVYRKKLDFAYVLEELRKGRGTQFDPQMVDILLSLIDDGTINVSKLYVESRDRSERGAGYEEGV